MVAKDAGANRVVVGARRELAASRVVIRDAVLYREGARVDRIRLRYRARPVACRVGAPPGPHAELRVELDEPFEGIAPGQAAVLMAGDLIVGHGTIASA